jgi:hypothetical protein
VQTRRVTLIGGPADLSATDRTREVATGLEEKVKIPHGAGYEHFRHDGEFSVVDGVEAAVFHWCGSTRVAE